MKSNLGAGVSNLGAGISSNSSVGGAVMFSGKKGVIARHDTFITNGVGQVYNDLDYSNFPTSLNNDENSTGENISPNSISFAEFSELFGDTLVPFVVGVGIKSLLKKVIGDFILPEGITFSTLTSAVIQEFGIGTFFESFAAYSVITIGVKFAGDMIGDLITKGHVDFSDYGTTLYEGAWQTVLGVAGGLAWGKWGERGGAALGWGIAKLTENLYSGEEARAWAGGAVLVGGAVGIVVVLALVSNPGGWIVCAALAGAAIGAAIVWVIDHYWDDIVSGIQNEYNRLSDEFEYQKNHNIVEGAWHVVENLGERGAEYFNNIWDDGYQFGDGLKTAWYELVVNPTQLLGDTAMFIHGQITSYVETACEKTEEIWDDGYQFGDGCATVGAWLGLW